MTKQEILNELKTVIAPYTTNKQMLNSINDQTDLIRDLKINSANLVDIIIDAEAKYDIEIDYDSADKMVNVGTCIDVINEKLKKKMDSSGNDIVSLNDIDIARTQEQRFYSKILSASETSLYHKYAEKIPFEHFVWLLWSEKESAYKFLQRNSPELIFSPTRFIVESLELPEHRADANTAASAMEGTGFEYEPVCKATLTFGSKTLYARSIICEEYIFSVVNNNNNFENTGWGIKYIDSASAALQSGEVREFLLNRLRNVLGAEDLRIIKNAGDCPVLTSENGTIDVPISLAHHGRWVAYSFQTDNLLIEGKVRITDPQDDCLTF